MAENTQEGDAEGALAANEDGSDIFMGQSLDDLENSIESDEPDTSEDNKESVDTLEQKDDTEVKESNSEETTKVKSGLKEKLKFISLIKISKKIKVIILVLVVLFISVAGAYYYFIYLPQQVKIEDKSKTIRKVVKKIEPIDLSIIREKKLNKKLKILLEDEKDILQKEQEKNIKTKPKGSIIQVAWLFEELDDEFIDKVKALGYRYEFCKKGKGEVLYLLVPDNKIDNTLSIIHNTIAKDAFIVTKDVQRVCL